MFFWFLSWVPGVFQFFLSFFSLISPDLATSIMVQLLSFLFTATISGFLALIYVSYWIITSHKVFTSSFLITHGGMFIPFFTSFQVVFPTHFPMNDSCNIIVPYFILLLCQLFTFAHNEILFRCSSHTFCELVIGAVLSILCFT